MSKLCCTNCGKEIPCEEGCHEITTDDRQYQPVCRDQYECYPRLVKNLHSKHMSVVNKNAARYAARG